MTIVLDCGTTNTKLYLVQGKSCIRETVLPVGIRNIAGGMTKTQLKNRIRDGIEHLVAESGTDEQVEKLVAYGMITSEMGFCELPHLDAPAGLAELQKGVCVQTDPELICGVPVVYSMLRAGVRFSDVYWTVRREVEASGLLTHYPRGNVGHSIGVGSAVSEAPFFTKDNDMILEENMVVTLETPYSGTGNALVCGGYNIEDCYLIQKDGAVQFTFAPDCLKW